MLTLMILLFDGPRGRAWLVAPPVLTGALWLVFAVVKVDLPALALP
jgi:hypothetical protein